MSSPTEQSRPEKHAVLLHWTDHEPPLEFVLTVEDRLEQTIANAPELGEVDGNEVGSGAATIYLYGPDADTLWHAIEPIVRSLPVPPSIVEIRRGEPGTPTRAITLRSTTPSKRMPRWKTARRANFDAL
ncbi:hypothetical protein [Mycolicibacterium smegmatis]|uniref:Uncharacterized protein n=1 Tax=Mycolicibacterium smegmatis (strain MKD8) TaxID=1214915 RepID=A0A2U9PUL3_MYCSE|nr:hypothetical protein [Mycolicibacterium smegmatis]AWT54975.1 hypothetical protein D806_040090 [Mycolicibacterium smegmatis MKD8]